MTHNDFITLLENTPVVAAIKDDEGLHRCIESDIDIIFILYGDIITLPSIIRTLKDAGKVAIVHIDLINGLSAKEITLDYLHKNTDLDGIITTKVHLISHAKQIGMITILRYFLLDSIAMENIKLQGKKSVQPDIVEILPGVVVPKVITKVKMISKVPIMASGLITEKEDIIHALNSGAIAISTTNQKMWFS
jgi:glycerol uptake operon antiterminator